MLHRGRLQRIHPNGITTHNQPHCFRRSPHDDDDDVIRAVRSTTAPAAATTTAIKFLRLILLPDGIGFARRPLHIECCSKKWRKRETACATILKQFNKMFWYPNWMWSTARAMPPGMCVAFNCRNRTRLASHQTMYIFVKTLKKKTKSLYNKCEIYVYFHVVILKCSC